MSGDGLGDVLLEGDLLGESDEEIIEDDGDADGELNTDCKTLRDGEAIREGLDDLPRLGLWLLDCEGEEDVED